MKAQASRALDEAGGLPLYYMKWSIPSNPRDPLLSSAIEYGLVCDTERIA